MMRGAIPHANARKRAHSLARIQAGRAIEQEILAIDSRREMLRLSLANADALRQANLPGTSAHTDAGRRIRRVTDELRTLRERMRLAKQYRTHNEILIGMLKARHGRSQWRRLVAEARRAHRAQDCEAILDELDDSRESVVTCVPGHRPAPAWQTWVKRLVR